MIKILLILASNILFNQVHAHEQWLLTAQEIKRLNQLNTPILFNTLTIFNVSCLIIASLGLLLWIVINYRIAKPMELSDWKINFGLFLLRFFLGFMLILCGLGFVPKIGVDWLTKATLFASDLIIPPSWKFIFWIEIFLGILLLLGVYIRVAAIALLLLFIGAFYFYGLSILQYAGFYIGSSVFLLLQGGGQFSLTEPNTELKPAALLILQILTGLNFIYSAISIKFMAPNLTLAILEKNNAFTFGIPYPEFVFLMLITEVVFGILLILGWQLRLISSFLLLLFIFLSIDLKENLLMHSFVYGILFVFILVGGKPWLKSHHEVSRYPIT